MKRCSTICSSLTTPTKVRSCCCNLSDPYDLSDAIRTASVLFFRLTGRQTKYAGTCHHTIRPCKKDACSCESCNSCCLCELDYIRLPGACSVDEVLIDGLVVDPSSYVFEAPYLYRVTGQKWPTCQDLSKNSSALNVQKVVSKSLNVGSLSVSALANGTFSLTGTLNVTGSALVMVDDNFNEWTIPTQGVLPSGSSWIFDPRLVTSDWGVAETQKLISLWTNTTHFGDVVPFNNYSVTIVSYIPRPFYSKQDDPCGTFQIKYSTGCCVPEEVQDAVAVLACEIAKARCGSNECRLPRNLRSFTLDGDRIVNGYDEYLKDGITGIDEVDSLIKSINPNKLYRSGRLLTGYVTGHRLHRR